MAAQCTFMHALGMCTSVDSVDEDRRPVLQVLIAYDSVTAAHNAMEMVCSMDFAGVEGLDIRPSPWRFDILGDPDPREFATADALNADMLIVSTIGGAELPGPVQRWLRYCLAMKCGDGAAIIALCRDFGSVDGAELPQLEFLRGMTQEAGLGFFALSSVTSRSLSSSEGGVQVFTGSITPLLDEPLYPNLYNRDWGLNE
jgi:hypothetical protein